MSAAHEVLVDQNYSEEDTSYQAFCETCSWSSLAFHTEDYTKDDQAFTYAQAEADNHMVESMTL